MLYFHDLQRAPEGAYLVAIPAELVDEVERRSGYFLMDREPGGEFFPISVVAFIVEGPERVDRYGLMVQRDRLDGTPEANADAIRRTMPDGWSLRVREANL